MAHFTVAEARALLPTVRGIAERIIEVRADLVVATRDEPVAPLAEAKALEAALSDLLDQLVGLGLQVKGWAPLLVDFPATRRRPDGTDQEILLCWLEGEADLDWYHDAAHGFAGRRRLRQG